MNITPNRVWVIKYKDGSYYSNASGSTLPTIFKSYNKAVGRLKTMSKVYIAYNELTVHMWEINEVLLGPTIIS